jgi:hypothetical protein
VEPLKPVPAAIALPPVKLSLKPKIKLPSDDEFDGLVSALALVPGVICVFHAVIAISDGEVETPPNSKIAIWLQPADAAKLAVTLRADIDALFVK